jgi:hypothetical protein
MQQGRLGVAPGIHGWAIIPDGMTREDAIPPAHRISPKAFDADRGFKERLVTFTLANRGGQTVAINVQPIN